MAAKTLLTALLLFQPLLGSAEGAEGAEAPTSLATTESITLAPGDIRQVTFPEQAEVRVSRRGVVDVFHGLGNQWQLTALRGGMVLVEAVDSETGAVVTPRLLVTVSSDRAGTAPAAAATPQQLTERLGPTFSVRRLPGGHTVVRAPCDSDGRPRRIADLQARIGAAARLGTVTVACHGEWSDVAYRLSARLFLIENSTALRLGFGSRVEASISVRPDAWQAAALARLEALAARREVRVVGRPVARLLPDWPLEIVSGGEFQITETTEHGADGQRVQTAWKQHGLHLKVRAVPLVHGRARIDLSGSLKSRDQGSTAALSVSSLETVFDLPLGVPVMAAALDLTSQNASVDTTPFLADLPLIGPLFRSKGQDEAGSRLLVWIQLDPETQDFEDLRATLLPRPLELEAEP